MGEPNRFELDGRVGATASGRGTEMSPVNGTSHDAETDTEAQDGTVRRRRLAVHALTVLAAVVLFLSAINVWVDRSALDTDNWVDAADELIAEDDIRTALSEFLVTELYASIDIGARLGEQVPDQLAPLAGSLAAALRAPATQAVDSLLATEAVANVWSQANRATHSTVVALLTGDTRAAVASEDGNVTLDLRTVVVALAEEIGLPAGVAERIPAEAGQVTVVESDILADLQTAVTVLQWASILLFLLVVALFVATVALAEGWRRQAARNVGIAVTIVGLLILAGLRIGGDVLLDRIVEIERNRPAAEAVWWIGTSLLRDIAWYVTIVGLTVIVAAALAAPSRAMTSVRRAIAPAFTGSPAVRWGIGAVTLLVLVWWAPMPILTTAFGIVLAAVLIAAGLEGMRRLCLADLDADDLEAAQPDADHTDNINVDAGDRDSTEVST